MHMLFELGNILKSSPEGIEVRQITRSKVSTLAVTQIA